MFGIESLASRLRPENRAEKPVQKIAYTRPLRGDELREVAGQLTSMYGSRTTDYQSQDGNKGVLSLVLERQNTNGKKANAPRRLVVTLGLYERGTVVSAEEMTCSDGKWKVDPESQASENVYAVFNAYGARIEFMDRK